MASTSMMRSLHFGVFFVFSFGGKHDMVVIVIKIRGEKTRRNV